MDHLRNVVYKVKKDTGVDVSHQTIENWILNHNYQNKDIKNRFIMDYYIFDVEWVEIKGIISTPMVFMVLKSLK